jgi:hypothetical protein
MITNPNRKMTQSQEDRFANVLKGWQFDRDRHGSLFDRGSADSYYGRAMDPHYGGVGGESGLRVTVTDAASVDEYTEGYLYNERMGGKKY